MLYVLFGSDNFSLTQELNRIKKCVNDDTSAGANITVLEGSQISLSDLKVTCETLPFLAEKRLVIINGLLKRFDAKAKTTTVKKSPRATDQIKEWQQIANCINNLPDTTILVLVDGEISNRNPLFKEITPVANIKAFSLLRRTELLTWIKKRVAQIGGKISTPAVDLVAKLVGNDLWTMTNEIDKLVLFTGGRLIEEKDIKAIVSHSQEANVFTMVDAILEGKTGFAEELLQQLLYRGAAPTYLLWMLHRQVRFIILVKELKALKKSMVEIQSRLGLSDFPLQKTQEQATKYSLEQLRSFYDKLLETDLAIKTGIYDGELALNILVVELCGTDVTLS